MEAGTEGHAGVPAARGVRPTREGTIPGLGVWEEPIAGRRYVIGADPAEGNPNSDESAACVVDAETWAEVAELAGKIEPSMFGAYLDELGRWYNNADVMAERNNHGHLLIRELQRLGNLRVLEGYDGRPGWLGNVKGKPLLYGLLADAVRDGGLHDVVRAKRIDAPGVAGVIAENGDVDDSIHSFAGIHHLLRVADVHNAPGVGILRNFRHRRAGGLRLAVGANLLNG